MNRPDRQVPRPVPQWRIMALILVALAVCCLVAGNLLMIKNVGPTWRGITVGRSTIDDVVTIMGAPTSVEQELEQTVYLYQEGPFKWGKHRIVVRDGVVECIVEDALAYPYNTGLTQFIAQYGNPDYVMWSSRTPAERIAVFLDNGIFASAVDLPLSKAQVTLVFYYQPRSLARLLVDFRDEISATNPFPDSDVVGPRDPWFGKP